MDSPVSRTSQCACCSEVTVTLHTLACGHRLCTRCVRVGGGGGGGGSGEEERPRGDLLCVFRCPVCNINSPLSPRAAPSLSSSSVFSVAPPRDELQERVRTHRRISAFVESSTAESGPPQLCDTCRPERALASSHCFQCRQNLCAECHVMHAESRAESRAESGGEHRTAPLLDSLFCRHHPQHVITAFCHVCRRNICARCAQEAHRAHDTESISSVAKRSREALTAFLTAEKPLNVNGRLAADVQAAIDDARETRTTYARFFGDFRRKLELMVAKVESIKHTVDDLFSETVANLQRYKESIDGLMENHGKLVEHARYLLQSVPDAEVVAAEAVFPSADTLHSLIQPLSFQVPVVDTKFEQMSSGLDVMLEDCEISYRSQSLGVDVDEVLSKEADLRVANEDKLKKLMKLSTRCSINCCTSDPTGPYIVLCTSDLDSPVKVYDYKARLVQQFGAGMQRLTYARGICYDAVRDLYALTTDNKVVRMDKGGVILDSFQVGARPVGIAHAQKKDVYVITDAPLHGRHQMHVVSPSLKRAVTSFGSTGSAEHQFDEPCAVHVTGVTGTEHPVFVVADRNNHAVKVFDLAGRHLKTYGGAEGRGYGELRNPRAVAVDWTNRVLVCDKDNARVVAFWAEGAEDYWKCLVDKSQLQGLPCNIIVDNNAGMLIVQMNKSIQIYQIVGK